MSAISAKSEVEKTILSDWNESNFSVCIGKIQELTINDDLSFCDYGIIFDQKAIEILKSPEFLSKSKEAYLASTPNFTPDKSKSDFAPKV